jgi:hypothetical protein
MDDLVRTGTIAVAGIYTAVILIIAGLLYVILWLWDAWMAGETGIFLLGITVLILIGLGYVVTGIWLRKIECI